MTPKEKEFINKHKIAHLSTVDKVGRPHIVPIVFVLDDDLLYTPVDGKPKKNPKHELLRLKNISVNSSVSVLFDVYSDDWQQLTWVQVRGRAEATIEGSGFERGKELLLKKYPQYTEMGISIASLIVITPEETLSWGFQGF